MMKKCISALLSICMLLSALSAPAQAATADDLIRLLKQHAAPTETPVSEEPAAEESAPAADSEASSAFEIGYAAVKAGTAAYRNASLTSPAGTFAADGNVLAIDSGSALEIAFVNAESRQTTVVYLPRQDVFLLDSTKAALLKTTLTLKKAPVYEGCPLPAVAFESARFQTPAPAEDAWHSDLEQRASGVESTASRETVTGTWGKHTWTLDGNGVLTISGKGDMDPVGFIPDPDGGVIDYYAWKAHAYWERITRVVIEDGVTSIGDCAFSGLQNMTSVSIPDSVTKIGNEAFHYSLKLTHVTIPGSVKTIGDSAFFYCPLTHMIIPDSVTSIGDRAFCACRKLQSVVIPDSVTHIGKEAFRECSGLTSIRIPRGISTLEYGIFAYCSGLTSVTIPDNIKSIGRWAFGSCGSLKEVIIPDTVREIGPSAFSYCPALLKVVIPEGVPEIGLGTFHSCTNLATVTIPYSVRSIGNNAFTFCKNLKIVRYGGSKTDWSFVAIGKENNPLLNADIQFSAVSWKRAPTDVQAALTEDQMRAVITWRVNDECTGYAVYEQLQDGYRVLGTVSGAQQDAFTTKPLDAGKHTFYVKNRNGASVGSASAKVTLTVPERWTLPITNLTARLSVDQERAVLSWTGNEACTGYGIYRKTAEGYQVLGSVTGADKTFFTTKALAPGAYTFYVKPKNGSRVGQMSALVSLTLPEPWRAAPINVQAALNDDRTKAVISWTGNGACTGYAVYEKTTDGYRVLGTVAGADKTAFTTGVLTPGKHTFYVKPRKGSSVGQMSATVTLTVPERWLAAPTDVQVKLSGKSAVITWTGNDACTGYAVYEKTAYGYRLLGTVTGANQQTFTTETLTPGEHTFFVKPRKGSAVGHESKTASITVPAPSTLEQMIWSLEKGDNAAPAN